MLKRTTIVCLTFILCGTFCIAQNKVSKEQYQKWVDYVNCKYLVAFIDKKIAQKSDEINESYKKDYQDKNRSKLDIKELSKAPIYSDIKKIVKDYKKGQMLYESVNKKTESLSNEWDKTQLINNLLSLPDGKQEQNKIDFKTYLEKTTNLLRTDLQKQIPDNFFSKAEHPPKKEDEVKPKEKKDNVAVKNVGNNKPTENNVNKPKEAINNSISSWWWFGLILVLIGSLFILIKWRKKHTVNRNNSINGVEQSYREEIHELKNDKKKLKREIEQLKIANKDLLSENIRLGQKIEGLSYKPQKAIIDTNTEHETEKLPTEVSETSASILYADAIIDGSFNRVKDTPNTNTIFELHLQNSQNATFTIYHRAMQRIVENPSFLEGCEKQVINSTQTVDIVNEGFAQRQVDGKWQITKKISIIIN